MKGHVNIAFALVVVSVVLAAVASSIALFELKIPLAVPPWKIAAEAGIFGACILLISGLYKLFFPTPQAANPMEKSVVESDLIKRYDEHVKFEFELTAQRITYLAISESFLFATYGTALNALSTHPDIANNPYASSLKQLVTAVPWIGLSLSVAVALAIAGAVSMIFKLKERRRIVVGGLHPDIGWRSLEHFFGLLPPVVIPVAFAVAWLCVWPVK